MNAVITIDALSGAPLNLRCCAAQRGDAGRRMGCNGMDEVLVRVPHSRRRGRRVRAGMAGMAITTTGRSYGSESEGLHTRSRPL